MKTIVFEIFGKNKNYVRSPGNFRTKKDEVRFPQMLTLIKMTSLNALF